MLSARLKSAQQLSHVFSCFFSRGYHFKMLSTRRNLIWNRSWLFTALTLFVDALILIFTVTLCCPYEQDVVMTCFRSSIFKGSFTGWVLLYQCGLAIKACLSDSGQQDALKYFSQIQLGAFVFICAGKPWVGIYSELCHMTFFLNILYIY